MQQISGWVSLYLAITCIMHWGGWRKNIRGLIFLFDYSITNVYPNLNALRRISSQQYWFLCEKPYFSKKTFLCYMPPCETLYIFKDHQQILTFYLKMSSLRHRKTAVELIFCKKIEFLVFFRGIFLSGCRSVNFGPILEKKRSLERYCGALFTFRTKYDKFRHTVNPLGAGRVFSVYVIQIKPPSCIVQ